MKIDADTKVSLNTTLLRASEPVLKRRVGITEKGESDTYEEVQFKVENISGRPLTDVQFQVQYFDTNGKFLGMEDDFHRGVLAAGGSWVASTILDFPKDAANATVEIEARAYTLQDRLAWARSLHRCAHCGAVPLTLALDARS